MNSENSKYSILPNSGFPKEIGEKLDLKAIAFWSASGFFAENDSFWKEVKWASIDYDQQPWKHEPRQITFNQAVDEFATIFHSTIARDIKDKQVILPLSGGLDSRSLAVALKHLGVNPYTYSYQFQGSFHETKYGEQIAKQLGWTFDAYNIPVGYLWDKIEGAARQNLCYTEFSHTRQVAVVDEVSQKGNLWLLGHWGDVLFNDMGVADDLPYAQQLSVIKKKILKPGGTELASDLWQAWGLSGSFEDQLNQRLDQMHSRIDIDNANARIRAFKSLYWATRWTTTNLTYFGSSHPMSLPYYDDEMCKFIMSLPEEYLADRRIQIEYIKRYGGSLANIEWQEKKPYNLYNFHKFRSSAHLPYRLIQKAKRTFKEVTSGKKLIQRNWENQFMQGDNPAKLESWLFDNADFHKLVPKRLVEKYYERFLKEGHVQWSHPLSMLLTLSIFCKQNKFKL